MGSPVVTIAMPVRNASRTVAAAINSILLQTFADWELLVVDDGSQDETAAVVGRFADPRIRLVAHARSAGLAQRLNEAISAARGRLFARMDGDDIAYPERLEAQVEFMIAHPQCDLVGCGAVFFNEAGEATGRYPMRATHEEIVSHPWRGFFLAHPTWLGRTEWFARHRYLPHYKKTQDQDLLLRTHDSSTFGCVDRVLLGYRQDARTLSKSLRGRIYFSRSIIRESWRRRAFGRGLRGVAAQIAKGLAESVLLPAGLDRTLRRGGAGVLDETERRRWAQVWAACNKST